MKNTIITIIVTLVILVLAFAALVKFNVIEFGHHDGDGHDHGAHSANDGHDHSKDKK